MRDATLLFLVKRHEEIISDILLAMKKRGFGMGKWNGVGGKVDAGETIEEAARREAKEEIGVDVGVLTKVAEISFYFRGNPEWNQLVHVYTTDDWKGEPRETEEMAPAWYHPSTIPYDIMWQDDIYWIPKMLLGEYISASFTFGENEMILEKKVESRSLSIADNV
jgi:8-oxo-dGTP pyrophosphatase MutT (NUDIX family)